MQRVSPQPRTSEHRPPTRRCDAKGCSGTTRERKPYCPEHIGKIDRPRVLMDMIQAVEDEIEQVGKVGKRAVDVDGLIVEEILSAIASQGQITWRRLVKTHVTFLHHTVAKTVDHYRDRLRDEGLITVGHNTRRVEIVELTLAGMKRTRRSG